MYSEKVMYEFLNPSNFGTIKGASGVGKISTQNSGEIFKIYILVEDGIIKDAQFQTFGGVVAIACSSVATKLMIGKSIDAVSRMSALNIYEVLGDVPENKMYLVQAVVNTMRAAVENYKRKANK